ncbi:hypothetical protein HYV12_04335 [Candidatus Dojkabacteria bacterium]|nr:hypothetical protein [Candidatus Dojkabacteria bacterium]
MSNRSLNNSLETAQRILYLLALIVVPLSILPLPWDLTEYSMTLSLALFTIPILALEISKTFINGSLIYPKNKIDTAILLLFVLFCLSTILSKSPITSFLGFDSRLGGGLVGLCTLLIFTYSARNFVRGIEGVIYSFIYLLIGVTLAAIFSILSFWGMNLLQFIPSFKDLFTVGLPLFSSARISIIIFGSAVILSSGLLFYAFKKYNLGLVITGILMFLTNLLAFLLYSLVQGSEQVILLLVMFACFLLIPFFRKRPLSKVFVNVSVFTFLIVLSGIVLLKIPQFKDLVVKDSSNLITQVTISPETGWKIATNTISESFWNGVAGYGPDTFSIAYNLYRPLTEEILVLNNTNFTYPNNQFLNIFISLGVLGVLVWIYLFYLVFMQLITDVKKRAFTETEDFLLLMLDVLSLFLLVSSVFIYFSFLIFLLLFLFITLGVVLRHMKKDEKDETFVLSLGFSIQRENESLNRNLLFAGVFVLLPTIWLYSQTVNYTLAGFDVLEAERITAEGRELSDRGKLSEEDRARRIVKASNLYGKAINKAPLNDMYHRRASLIVGQYVQLLVDKYNKTDIESEKKELFDDITAYADIAVEESKIATDRAPQVYANWGTRANVYSNIVGIGFKVYSKSALSSMQTAASLNPLNYELYYNAAQLYVVNNDNDSAIRTLTQVFTINPEHIPSNVLAGELSLNDKDYKQADRYFAKAKEVMDKYGSTDTELYKYVVKRLTEISPNLPKKEDETSNGDTKTTETNLNNSTGLENQN